MKWNFMQDKILSKYLMKIVNLPPFDFMIWKYILIYLKFLQINDLQIVQFLNCFF